jgi:ABC-2 type transport system ATP-binding protein
MGRATNRGGEVENCMIQADGLTKYYGDKPAIRDVSFSVQKGEVLGFLGPNAAGKTTTMRILTGFLPATDGRATVAGCDVFADSLEARRHIGYMPETVPLYPEMTIRGYLSFFADVRRVPQAKKRMDHVMEMVDVGRHADDRIAKLSKGFRQRVGLAQALLHDPEVLILDEPTVGLDPKQIIEFRQLIKSLGGEHTVILSTHILPEVSQTCGRVLIINEGRIVAEDTPQNLTSRLQSSERVLLRLARPQDEAIARLGQVPGVTGVTSQADGMYEVNCALGSDRREDLAAAVVQGGWGLLEMRTSSLTLEEVFLKLTTKEEETDA